MFFELAIGIKAVVIIVSLIGLFLGLFPEVDLWPSNTHDTEIIESAPEITNEWTALAVSEDAARDDVLQAVKEHQETARQADDNATRVALYQQQQQANTGRIRRGYTALIWFLIGAVTLSFPWPKRGQHTQ